MLEKDAIIFRLFSELYIVLAERYNSGRVFHNIMKAPV